jgi:hypothetical protein
VFLKVPPNVPNAVRFAPTMKIPVNMQRELVIKVEKQVQSPLFPFLLVFVLKNG